jgi:hypothetical protein
MWGGGVIGYSSCDNITSALGWLGQRVSDVNICSDYRRKSFALFNVTCMCVRAQTFIQRVEITAMMVVAFSAMISNTTGQKREASARAVDLITNERRDDALRLFLGGPFCHLPSHHQLMFFSTFKLNAISLIFLETVQKWATMDRVPTVPAVAEVVP